MISRLKEMLGFFDDDLLVSKIVKQGEIVYNLKPCTHNYKIVMRHKYINLRYNIFNRRIYLGNEILTQNDVNIICDELQPLFNGYNIKINDIDRCASVIANENKFNPLKEYFESLPAPTTTHLNDWIVKITGCEDTPLNRILARKWLISGVARAMDPGCQIEGSLIFSGDQGDGKSSVFRNLNPAPEYYCGSKVDISDTQKACQTFLGKFIIEFAEMATLKKQAIEDVKQYLTNAVDTYVPKYENKSVDVPRMCIYGGSSNKDAILADTTGNRRFWVIKTHKSDYELVATIRDELWSEAYQAYKAGEIWHLTPEERKLLDENNQLFEFDDPKYEYLYNELNRTRATKYNYSACELLTMLKMFDQKSTSFDVSNIMQRMKWEKKHTKTGNKYFRPAPLDEDEGIITNIINNRTMAN